MINKQLHTLYFSKLSTGFPCILQQFRQMRRGENPPAYPLLLKVNEEQYDKADLKIMVFGQETNSWEHKICSTVTPINQSLEIVEATTCGFMDYYQEFLEKWGINSPFWYSLKKIKGILSASLPDKTIEIVWNNIYKIGNKGKSANRPSKSIRDFENEHFNVIQAEVDILKPNVILFFTGPNYENRVKKIFPIISSAPLISNIKEKELSKYQLENCILAYRTYHPNHLQLNKKWGYVEAICNDLLKQYSIGYTK